MHVSHKNEDHAKASRISLYGDSQLYFVTQLLGNVHLEGISSKNGTRTGNHVRSTLERNRITLSSDDDRSRMREQLCRMWEGATSFSFSSVIVESQRETR